MIGVLGVGSDGPRSGPSCCANVDSDGGDAIIASEAPSSAGCLDSQCEECDNGEGAHEESIAAAPPAFVDAQRGSK